MKQTLGVVTCLALMIGASNAQGAEGWTSGNTRYLEYYTVTNSNGDMFEIECKRNPELGFITFMSVRVGGRPLARTALSRWP